jgi:hypothetical protein
MQTVPRLVFPKLVLIQPGEFSWVKNLLNLAWKDPQIKKACLKWRPGTYPSELISTNPKIVKNGHSGGSICWTVAMAQNILNHGSKIRSHKDGISYEVPY